ncbi:SO2930 family diheme c-type cytochrome [Parasphingopyxis sp.]|uniref:SO2930 family diheme c-type cytochrome n=1 Tax=Parasphingopyxis sp. TaxID=1920299 RepID=UPI0026117228|nr:SO2930 family diheme c-type cytochrome [Parasphingopyxis sp.]
MIRALAAMAGWLALVSASPPAPVSDTAIMGDSLPRNLSEFHFFTDDIGHTPNDRVIGYELNTALFSDYALKNRFVYVPEGQTATYNADGVFEFPVGSALIKSFGYPADFRDADSPVRWLETRVLLRRADGWVALPYVWNEDGTDAVLRRAGRRIPVTWIDAQGEQQSLDYRVPNQNQCKTCHSSNDEIALIGPNARNLNDGQRLAQWVDWSILDRAPDDAPRVPVWDDEGDGTLDERARAYIDINCAHCHSRTGSASNSGLFLGYNEMDEVARGILKRPVAAGRGSGGRDYDIEPGHPERSIFVYRMRSRDPGVAMPELGRGMLHEEGIALIERYIAAMDERS